MKLDTRLVASMLAGELIITKNQLSAERLHRLFLEHCLARNIKLIEKPMILSIEDWITNLCYESIRQDFGENKRLLNDIQSENLWRKIMGRSFVAIPEKIQLAYQAWMVCQLLSIDYPFSIFTQHSNQWQQWALQFEQQCRLQGWIDKYHYLASLIKEDRLQTFKGPQKICLVGLSTTDSYYQVFFKYLSQKGYAIQSYLIATAKKPLVVDTQSYSNIYTELYTIADQAWEYWKENPEKAIGCAIVNLKATRDTTLMAFQTVYHSIFNSAVDQKYPLILPLENCQLSHHPAIQTALDILGLNFTSLELIPLSRLLRTGYVKNDASEQARRIQLEKKLRAQPSLRISFQTLMEQGTYHNCFELVSILKQWEQHYRHAVHREQSYTAWAHYFRLQLQTWGWLTLSNLSPEEIYYLNIWQQALGELASLDLVHDRVGYHTALQTVIQRIESMECPLQIDIPQQGIYLIDLQETALFHWDKLWVIYSNNSYLFNGIAQNPFIPFALQGDYSDHNRYLTLLKEVVHVSSATTFSIAEEEYEQVNQHLSQWIEVPIRAFEKEKSANAKLFTRMQDTIQWEYQTDHQGPNLAPGNAYQEARLLHIQSLCPFRAFADYRLGLKQHSLTWPQGVSYAEKSKLLYQLLTTVWSELQTQTKLKSLSVEQLNQLLMRIINNEIRPLLQKQSWIWQPTFTQLEKERLHKVLTKWLEIEKARPSFRVIETQQLKTYCIGPLQLSFMIDRVDQVDNGKILLVHYKASTTILPYHEWIKNGALSFQLSLCALSNADATKALTFLQFHPDHQIKFYGMSEEKTDIPGIHTLSEAHLEMHDNTGNWNRLFQFWHHQLEALAKQFYQGDAFVKPKEGSKTCQKCQYGLLCRIKEINAVKLANQK